MFSVEPLSADKIAEKVKRFPKREITIYCNALSPAATKLCADLKLNAVCADEVYLLFKRHGLLPEKYICDPPKRTFKDSLLSFTDKANGKSFILGGIGLLIFSLFTLFPIYYLISGSILTVFGLAVRFLPKHSKT